MGPADKNPKNNRKTICFSALTHRRLFKHQEQKNFPIVTHPDIIVHILERNYKPWE